MLVLLAVLAPGLAGPAQALSGSEFSAGRIISDQVFFNTGTMSQASIQSFLTAKEQGCSAAYGYPCLKDYTQSTSTRAVSYGRCSGYDGAANEPASQIIYKVSKACGINPQVLLVLLEKEQGLVSSKAPTSWKYQAATGYGCPDTSACNSLYYGFYNQVYRAAWQLKEYVVDPGYWRYHIGDVAVQYSPNAACGSSVVKIENGPTAALYNYTPYQPNRAALNNLYGPGDACSAYGNRNFWVYFNNWFGSPTGDVSVNPIGNVEVFAVEPGKLRVAGWAFDGNSTDPIHVQVTVGTVGHEVAADLSRPDVAAAYPGSGTNHGFDTEVNVATTGVQQVCVHAINVGGGSDVLLGCRSMSLMGGSPIGEYDPLQSGSNGVVTASGWVFDPDTKSPIPVHIYVDGTGTAYTADAASAVVAQKYPAYGNDHGFDETLKVEPGSHNVCAYGINVGSGANVQLGCQSVTVAKPLTDQGRAPIGNYEAAVLSGSKVTVSGWTLDPDTAASIAVHIYVDNVGTAFVADKARSDVGAAYPVYGDKHGFAETVPVPVGTHSVCAYGINTGAGGHTLLGCKTVTVAAPITEEGRAPIGNYEAAVLSGSNVTVSGWALDRDTTASIPVHVYVDNVGKAFVADTSRPDVQRAFPGYGDRHGFSATVPVPVGAHSVCAYAINTGPGGHTLLGCKTVTVAAPISDQGRAPIGNYEAATVSGSTITVSGWALDRDTTASIPVHVYVDNVGTAFVADKPRPDVGRAFAGYGDNHGFSASVSATVGTHSVCAYGINTGAGGHTLLGCKTVTVR